MIKWQLGIQEWFNIRKIINTIKYINNKSKIKHDYSNKCRKYFDTLYHSFLLKTLESICINRLFLKLIKSIYLKASANIICNGDKLEAFPVTSDVKQGCTLLSILFNIVLEIQQQQ